MQLSTLRALVSALARVSLVVVLVQVGSAQTTWHVDDDACPGPGSGTALDPFCRIQDGINASSSGDTVLVSPGTYVEHIHYFGKAITVSSTGGAAVTTIDGGSTGDVVIFDNGEGPDSVLDGFTITNGNAGVVCNKSSSPTIRNNVVTQNAVVGIYCYDGSCPTIRSNTITRNTAPGSGAGIGCGAKSCPLIENNVISENVALSPLTHGGGGGIFLSDSSPTIIGNVIVDNTALYKGGGIYCYYYSSPYIANNIIARNSATAAGGGQGAGIACRVDSSPVIINNTIFGNVAGQSAGGIFQFSSSYPSIKNTIVWGNVPDSLNSFFDVTYSDIEGGSPGVGNKNADPLFTDPVNGDFFLLAGSPCIDSGDPASPLDCDGSRADMGAIPAIPPDDCNGNLVPDVCDLYAGTSLDCNFNGIPDECDIASGFSKDCNQNGIPDECEGASIAYCTAKVNSLGCTPAIGATGGCPTAPSLSGPDDYFITAENVLNNKPGIMIWSHGPNSLPFMGGILCVAPPIIRTPVQHSGGNPPPPDCSGSYSYHFAQAYMASWFLTPGTKLYAQYWSRDPGFSPPNNVGLTDGLEFVVGP